MRRASSKVIILFFLVSNLLFSSRLLAMEGTLLVANRDGGSISLIDFPTRVEVARLPIGPVIPHEVDVSPDGRLALTSEYGTKKRHGQHLVLIDIETATVLSRIDLGPNSRPHTALFLPDGKRAVATLEESDQLALIDLEAGEVVRTYPTGAREGHMVRLSPDGSRAYVTSRKGKGALSVIFLDEERDTVVVPTGAGAEGLAVNPAGSEIWVANRGEETISVIDAASLKIVATLPSRPYAGRIEMTADGRYAVVPNGSGAGEVPNYLRVYDVKKRQMIAEKPLRDGTPQIGYFGILIRGDTVFVTDPLADLADTFELPALIERELFLRHHEAPDGMAWSPRRVAVMEK